MLSFGFEEAAFKIFKAVIFYRWAPFTSAFIQLVVF
jgi:hypothetical protein